MATTGRGGAGHPGLRLLWGVGRLNATMRQQGWYLRIVWQDWRGAGVRMLHQHESRAVVGVWDRMVETSAACNEGRIEDWSAEACYAP